MTTTGTDQVVRLDGVTLIAAERRRQIAEEGYTAEHDDAHASSELAAAAACYAYGEDLFAEDLERGIDGYKEIWPFEDVAAEAVVGKTRLRQLVIAGALIAAEIDRLLRGSEGVVGPAARAVADDACLAKIGAGEPRFTLRAQDVFADVLVDEWADNLEAHLGVDHDLDGPREEKIANARATAEAMRAWPTRKVPD